MSIEALNWARKIYCGTAKLSPKPKLVGDAMAKSLLRAVADYANDSGFGWPSMERLALDCDMSVDSVRRRLEALARIGVLAIRPCWMDERGKRNHDRRGRQTSSDIQLLLAKERTRDSVLAELGISEADVAETETDDDPTTLANSKGGVANSKGGVAIGEGSQWLGAGSQSARGGVALQLPPNELPSNSFDRIEDAGARGRSVFTEGSKTLASAFWNALGFTEPIDIPPEFAGVDYRAVKWEATGWTADLIDAEARKIARDKPLKPLSYFEKVFATSFAKRQTPLPVVEVRAAEQLTVTSHGRPQQSGNIIQAADRLLETLRSFDAGPGGGADELRRGEGARAVRQLPQR